MVIESPSWTYCSPTEEGPWHSRRYQQWGMFTCICYLNQLVYWLAWWWILPVICFNFIAVLNHVLRVYGNLYYLMAQAEETSATDKYAGFVLRKEVEEFVEQSANLLKYDMLQSPAFWELAKACKYLWWGRVVFTWRLYKLLMCNHSILVVICLQHVCLKAGSGFVAEWWQ